MNPEYLGGKNLWQMGPDRSLVRQRLARLIQEHGVSRLNQVFEQTLADPATPGDWEIVSGAALHRLLALGLKTDCSRFAGVVYDICLLGEQSILVLETLTALDRDFRPRNSVEQEKSALARLKGLERVVFLGILPAGLAPAFSSSNPWDLPPVSWARIAHAYGDDPLLISADSLRTRAVRTRNKINGFAILDMVEKGENFLLRAEGGSQGDAFRSDLASGAWLFRRYETDFCHSGSREEGWFEAHEFTRRVLDSSRLARAFFYAENLHRKQLRRGGGVPYVSHLLAVSAIALEYGADEDEAVSALFHDALEDQGGEGLRGEIHRMFGPRVLEIVEGCTEVRAFGSGWKGRKIAHALRMRSASKSVALVYASDKLHNVRSMLADYRRMGERTWDKFHAGREEQLWYYRELTGIFHDLGYHPILTGELERTLQELEGLIRQNGAEKS